MNKIHDFRLVRTMSKLRLSKSLVVVVVVVSVQSEEEEPLPLARSLYLERYGRGSPGTQNDVTRPLVLQPGCVIPLASELYTTITGTCDTKAAEFFCRTAWSITFDAKYETCLRNSLWACFRSPLELHMKQESSADCASRFWI